MDSELPLVHFANWGFRSVKRFQNVPRLFELNSFYIISFVHKAMRSPLPSLASFLCLLWQRKDAASTFPGEGHLRKEIIQRVSSVGSPSAHRFLPAEVMMRSFHPDSSLYHAYFRIGKFIHCQAFLPEQQLDQNIKFSGSICIYCRPLR